MLKVPDANEKVWRYMDLAKFISLIDRHGLFFSSVDLFGDPYEGRFPQENPIESAALSGSKPLTSGRLQRSGRECVDRRRYLVNSWHMSEYESAAMWAIYSQFNSGIAIQSTYERLAKSFRKSSDKIYISKVTYIDYTNEKMAEHGGNPIVPFLYKRKSFSYENELRVITIVPKDKQSIKNGLPSPADDGKYIPVDLNTLIERIYVSPRAPPWLGDLVESILQRFGQSQHQVIVSKLFSLA